MASKYYEFEVKMSCGSCSKAVEKVLEKQRANGVEEYTTDLPSQTVKVKTTDALDYDTVYNTINKTGKQIISGKEVESF